MARTKTKTTTKNDNKRRMSAGDIARGIADATKVHKNDVHNVLRALIVVASDAVAANGVFILPGVAKITKREVPAKPARQGVNPFTKEPTTFAAKPASTRVLVRPLPSFSRALSDS